MSCRTDRVRAIVEEAAGSYMAHAGKGESTTQAIREAPRSVVCCRKCGDEFKSVHDVRKHQAHAHDQYAEWEQVCEECNEEFVVPLYLDRKFCSHDCYAESRRKDPEEVEKVTSTCEGCGETFSHYPSIEQRHCSRECVSAPEETETCAECGEEFTQKCYEERTFCSKECVDESGWKTSVCQFCQAEFDHYRSEPKKYCSRDCYFAGQKNGSEELKRIIVTRYQDSKKSQALQGLAEAGYRSPDDIAGTVPKRIEVIDGVGPTVLKLLTEEIDDFDGSDYFRTSTDTEDRPHAEVTHCPACDKKLEDGEMLSHILNCEERF